MATDLGFVILETIVQPILPHSEVDPDALAEVRDELGYDLIRTDEPLSALVDGFRDRVPAYALRYARQWAKTAPVLAPHYRILRDTSLSPHARGSALDALKRATTNLPNVRGLWMGGP